ncbi:MAG TPA: LacI family DNA-binding transcriptional regulator [Armatimonadota bacterium]|nr:LacI family DNA-binding transcriptional regulator [Armatimonadota bacterium]
MPTKQRQTQSTRTITQADIARSCETTQATVSRALQGDPSIGEEMIEKIRSTAIKMGYNPAFHEGARRLALRRTGQRSLTHLIALYLPPHFHFVNFYIQIFQGIMEELIQAGYTACFGFLDRNTPLDTFPLEEIVSRGDIDGIIAHPGSIDFSHVVESIRHNAEFGNRPIVSLANFAPGVSNIQIDVTNGAYSAAKHLLALGHRHIMHFAFPVLPDEAVAPEERFMGVRMALEEHNLDPQTHLHLLPIDLRWHTYIRNDTSEVAPGAFGDMLVQHLREHPEITAIMGLNDATALRAWYSLRQAGFRIPEDISIIGFDDTDPVLNEFGQNVLTSVHSPTIELGRQAAKTIVAQITGEQRENSDIIMPTSLVVRQSTASPSR